MSRPKKDSKLSGEKVDSFNSLLSIAMYECKHDREVNHEGLEKALLNVDSELFTEEVKLLGKLKGLVGEEAVTLMQTIDKSTTYKVKERGRD